MCVEIKRGTKAVQAVVAYRMFDTSNGTLTGISCHGSNITYEFGKVHVKKPHTPGFQAFVDKETATEAHRIKWLYSGKFQVYEVILLNAKLGVIEGMDGYSNGKPGWAAEKMILVRKLS